MKRITNSKRKSPNGLTIYVMARLCPDGRVYQIGRAFLPCAPRNIIALDLLEARAELRMALRALP